MEFTISPITLKVNFNNVGQPNGNSENPEAKVSPSNPIGLPQEIIVVNDDVLRSKLADSNDPKDQSGIKEKPVAEREVSLPDAEAKTLGKTKICICELNERVESVRKKLRNNNYNITDYHIQKICEDFKKIHCYKAGLGTYQIPKGAIINGQPGTGKTYLSEQLAELIADGQSCTTKLKGTDLIGKNCDATKQLVTQLFETAKQEYLDYKSKGAAHIARTYVYCIDEADAAVINKKTYTSTPEQDAARTTLQSIMSGTEQETIPNIYIIFTTNVPFVFFEQALRRNGRLSLDLKLKGCDDEHLENLLKKLADDQRCEIPEDLLKDVFILNRLKGKTAADLIKILSDALIHIQLDGKCPACAEGNAGDEAKKIIIPKSVFKAVLGDASEGAEKFKTVMKKLETPDHYVSTLKHSKGYLDDLIKSITKFSATGSGFAYCYVQGGTGSGKTALCREVIKKLKDEDQFDFDNVRALVLKQHHQPEIFPEDAGDLIDSNNSYNKSLIIIDGADQFIKPNEYACQKKSSRLNRTAIDRFNNFVSCIRNRKVVLMITSNSSHEDFVKATGLDGMVLSPLVTLPDSVCYKDRVVIMESFGIPPEVREQVNDKLGYQIIPIRNFFQLTKLVANNLEDRDFITRQVEANFLSHRNEAVRLMFQ